MLFGKCSCNHLQTSHATLLGGASQSHFDSLQNFLCSACARSAQMFLNVRVILSGSNLRMFLHCTPRTHLSCELEVSTPGGKMQEVSRALILADENVQQTHRWSRFSYLAPSGSKWQPAVLKFQSQEPSLRRVPAAINTTLDSFSRGMQWMRGRDLN